MRSVRPSASVLETISNALTHVTVASHTVLITSVGRSLLLGLSRKKNGRPIGYFTFLAVIFALNRVVQRL